MGWFSWTEVNDLNTNRSIQWWWDLQHTGLYEDMVPSTGDAAITESWNGSSSWTEVGDLNTARYGLAGGGTNRSISNVEK